MRQQCFPVKDFSGNCIIMLPYKGHEYTRSYGNHEDCPTTHTGSTPRNYIEPSAFEDLVQKVDWLVDEVRYIKQTLLSHQRKEWERATYERYKLQVGEQGESSRNNIFPRHEQSETNLYEQHDSYAESEQDCKVDVSSVDVVTSTPHMIRQYISSTSQQNDRRSSEFDRHLSAYDQESHSQRARTFPYEILSRSDHESHYSSDSPVSTGSRPERIRSNSELIMSFSRESNVSTNSALSVPDDVDIAQVIILWERGLKDVPAVISWTVEQKLRCREKLELWFRVYHLYQTLCKGDVGRFISQYSDTASRMFSVSEVASLCPDVTNSYEAFIYSRGHQDNHQDGIQDGTSKKVYTLPRKINGRKVSAKDVIQLWEGGMGEIPPIKTWTKVQKFKQQSKISRWKKIVDIFKYQCNSDMRKFEEIYTDSHGCLLPVAAITSRFETVYGDELNITSKLMTVSTTDDLVKLKTLKRRYDSSFDDEDTHVKLPNQNEGDMVLCHPPSMIRKTPSPPKLLRNGEEEEEDLQEMKEEVQEKGFVVLSNFNRKDNESSTSHPLHKAPINSQPSFQFENQSSPDTSNESDTNDTDSNRNPTNYVSSNLRNSDSCKNCVSDKTQSVFAIPESLSAEEAVIYWIKGSSSFPSIMNWTSHQKLKQKDLVAKIESIYLLYVEHFKHDLNDFLLACSNEKDEPLNIDEVLTKYETTLNDIKKFHCNAVKATTASSMTFDFSHHKTISQSKDALYLLPRKINGRKVNAKDVLQLWYHGLNRIPPVRQWSPQQKAVQQSKISRWKKIVDLFEQDFGGDWERFEKHFSNNLGQLLPITAIITKHEEDSRSMGGTTTDMYHQ